MFQYIKRNILRRCASPNNDFGFLADQLLYQAPRTRCRREGTHGSSFGSVSPSPGLNIAAPCLPPLFKAIILTGDKHEHGVMASY